MEMKHVLTNLHTHTCYGDGKNTPEEIVQAALAAGLDCLGFSEHSPSACCFGMPAERVEGYYREIRSLQKKYAGRIRILCGLEQESTSPAPELPFDYLIGSNHTITANGKTVSVDTDEEVLRHFVEEELAGDWYRAAELYFEAEGQVPEKTNADIIGHFDLISKFNEGDRLYDSSHPRYRAAWQKALDRLLPCGKPFELNTGAISRGYRREPYPSREMIGYIRERGGRLLLSSDSHRKDTLLYAFSEWEALLTEEERTYSFHL